MVEDDVVVQRQRRELDNVDVDAGVFKRLQRLEHLIAFHGEQADLGLQRKAFLLAAAAHLLVIPDHVFQRKGNLLAGFVLDDVGDLLLLDRRQLDEAGQADLARNADGDPIALDVVAREKRRQRFGDQLVWIGFGLTEDLGIFDVVEGDDFHLGLVVVRHAAHRLERALTDVDSPHGVRLRHGLFPPNADRKISARAQRAENNAQKTEPHNPARPDRLTRSCRCRSFASSPRQRHVDDARVPDTSSTTPAGRTLAKQTRYDPVGLPCFLPLLYRPNKANVNQTQAFWA